MPIAKVVIINYYGETNNEMMWTYTHDSLVQNKKRSFSKRNKKVNRAKVVTDKHTYIQTNTHALLIKNTAHFLRWKTIYVTFC